MILVWEYMVNKFNTGMQYKCFKYLLVYKI